MRWGLLGRVCGFQWRRPGIRGHGGGRAGRASQPMDGRTTPDPIAGQLMCPSHGKLCKKGICSGLSRLVREDERKKREVETVVVGEVDCVRLLAPWSVRVQPLFSSRLCSSVKTSLYAILFPPNWAQEPCELKCEIKSWDTCVATHFHFIQY